ncbi:hypothetical protein IAT40_003795 [Kwoniella sp. CBS 6097]
MASPSSSSATPTPPSSPPSPISRAGSLTPPALLRLQSRPAQVDQRLTHQENDPDYHIASMDLVDLVDLDSPPTSPGPSLRRTASSFFNWYAQRQGSSHMDDMRSLIDGDDGDDGDNDDVNDDPHKAGTHDPDIDVVSNMIDQLDLQSVHQQDQPQHGPDLHNDDKNDDEDDIQPTPRASPEPPALDVDNEPSIPIPEISRNETPTPTLTVDTRTSSDDSNSSRSHLSANASPFKFVERPRTMSIARSATPPSFFSDRNDTNQQQEQQQGSEAFDGDHSQANNLSPTQPRNLSVPSRLPSHGYAAGFGMPSSVPMQLTKSLPAYPYPFDGAHHSYERDPSHLEVQVQENTTFVNFSPRESRAIKIVSPEISRTSPPPILPSKQEADAEVQQGKVPLGTTGSDPNLSPSPAASKTDPPSDGSKLYQRRRKEEILSLYSLPPKAASPSAISIPAVHSDAAVPPIKQPTLGSTLLRAVTTTLTSTHVPPHMIPLPSTPMRSGALDTWASSHIGADAWQLQPSGVKPLLTPPMSEHGYGDELDEILGQVKQMDKLCSDRDAAEIKFKDGLRYLREGLKHSATNHVCIEPGSPADRSSLVEMQSQLRALREDNARLSGSNEAYKAALDDAHYESTEAYKETLKLRAENEVFKDNFREVTLRNSQLEITAAHMKKRKDELKQAVRTMSKGYRAQPQDAPQAQSHPFVVILLDGHPRMFDPDLLEQARIGGEDLAQRLIKAAKQATAVHLPGEDIPFLTGMLFVDVAGLVESFGQFRDFCDGFNSFWSLLSLVDTDGSEGTSNKVRENLKFYCSMSNCKMILIASDTADEYIDLILAPGKKSEGPSKIYAIRSTDDIETDPYIGLGKDRLVFVKGLFSIDPKVWNRQVQSVNRPSTISEVSASVTGTSPGRSQARAISPVSSSTVRARPVSPAEPSSTAFTRNIPIPARQPSLSTKPPPRAPWDTRKKTSAETQHKDTDAQSEFKSVVDRPYNLSPITTPKASTVRSYVPPGSPAPRRASHTNEMIVVPIRAGEDESIGGSPPESDEDEPSVLLPHSALKHVQRPTVIERQPEPPIQHGFKIRGAAAAAGVSAPPTRGPSSVLSVSTVPITPAHELKDTAPWKRKTPLPMNQRIQRVMGASAGSGSNNKPLGGKPAPSAQPRPADFQFLRDLDPKPCHNHYLKGSCTDPECVFGHHYSLEIGQWNALRVYVKQMVS